MSTRRAILQGIVALPVAAVPAIIPDRVAIAAIHPDAALLALQPQIEAMHAVCQALVERVSAAETLRFAGKPSPDLRAAEAAQEAAEDVWCAASSPSDAINSLGYSGFSPQGPHCLAL